MTDDKVVEHREVVTKRLNELAEKQNLIIKDKTIIDAQIAELRAMKRALSDKEQELVSIEASTRPISPLGQQKAGP